jgi:hypothetical protein
MDVIEPVEVVDSGEAALILQYGKETDIPAPLDKWYRAFDTDRRYVNNDCMALDAEDAVGTNHILRNQWTFMALVNSREADISIEPDDAVWPETPELAMDPMTGQPMMDPMTGGPLPSGKMLPGEPPPELLKLSRTMEVLARKLLNEARFRQQLAGAIQDVETNAIMFVKVNQQDDLMKDPLGNYRFNDQQDNFALYNFWAAKKAAGEIQEGSAEDARFKALETTIRQYTAAMIREQIQSQPLPPSPVIDPMMGQPVMDPMTGQPQMQPTPDPRVEQADQIEAGLIPLDPTQVPEVAKWIGFPIDFVQPEDIRFSWNITRPEDFWRSDRVQHRVYMTRDAAAAKYQLTPEDAKTLPSASGISSATSTNGDPSSRDSQLSDKQIGDQVELWECHDRTTNCVYVYAKGRQKFLHKYTPTVVWRNWFPFIPFIFNRVTGRFVGISSASLQRPAQEEINLMRTLDRHAKKACFPRILVKKGVFSKGEAKKYKRAMPYEIIELDTPDELNAAIKETSVAAYDPRLTDDNRAQMDLQRMAGVSLVSGGAVGVSNSATETATAQQGTDAMTDYRRGIIEDLYVDVVTCLLDMAATALPEENVKALCGSGAFWPPTDRQTFWRNTSVKIRAGSTGKPDIDKRLAWATNIVQLASALGLQPQGPQILDEITRDSGIFTGLSKFFQMAPMPSPNMGGPGGPPKPGGAGGPPRSPPGIDSQQGQGGGTGNKPMQDAPGPQSIPNRPQV